MRNWKTSVLLLSAIAMAGLTGCSSDTNKQTGNANTANAANQTNASGETTKPDTSEKVDLTMYILGDPPVDQAPLDELNNKLLEKANATLTVKYAGWDSSAYGLLFTSGEEFDLVYVGNGNYSNLARGGALKPLDDLLPQYAPLTWEKTPKDMWEAAKIDGKIYAIPGRYTEYIPGGLVYRGDLLKKHGLKEITNLDEAEAYFDKLLSEDKIVPFEATPSYTGYYMADMFVNLTKGWLSIENVPISGLPVVAESKDNPKSLIYPAFTDEFVEFAKRMKTWNDKGYWPKDILSAEVDPYTEFIAGKTAAYFQHAAGFIGTYGAMTSDDAAVDPLFYSFGEASQKITKTAVMANDTAVSNTSKNPERALMVYDLLLNDKEINQLLQYGIKGKNYDLNEEGKRIQPASFDESKDAYSMATWAIRADENVIPNATDYPKAEELYGNYNSFAFQHPYTSFAFDTQKVASEISAVGQVNAGIGLQILFGKVKDPVAAIEDYRSQLEKAGINKIMDEVKAQIENYTPVK